MNASRPTTGAIVPRIVTGSGRSGTKWILHILDLHPDTHCRNEPHRLDRGLLRPELAAWEDSVRRACSRYGPWDAPLLVAKGHIHPWARAVGLDRLMFRRKFRRLTGLGHEWALPWWVGSPEKLRQATHILKVINARAMAVWLLENRPDVPLIHLVRHPGGMLNSWLHRYVGARDPNEVLKAQHAIAAQVAESDAGFARLMGDPERLSLPAAKLWAWCYAQVSISRAGDGKGSYMRVVYEDLVANTAPIMRQAFTHFGLQPPTDFEGLLARKAEGSRETRDRWRERLDPVVRDTLDDVLERAGLATWWPQPSLTPDAAA